MAKAVIPLCSGRPRAARAGGRVRVASLSGWWRPTVLPLFPPPPFCGGGAWTGPGSPLLGSGPQMCAAFTPGGRGVRSFLRSGVGGRGSAPVHPPGVQVAGTPPSTPLWWRRAGTIGVTPPVVGLSNERGASRPVQADHCLPPRAVRVCTLHVHPAPAVTPPPPGTCAQRFPPPLCRAPTAAGAGPTRSAPSVSKRWPFWKPSPLSRRPPMAGHPTGVTRLGLSIPVG